MINLSMTRNPMGLVSMRRSIGGPLLALAE
jgi:hypothetical protein